MALQTQNQIKFELKLNEQTEFSRLLQKAIDEAFSSVSNDNNKAIYNHLENTFKIKKQEIPNKLAEFANAIEATFGLAAELIEIRIMANVHKHINNHAYYPKDDKVVFSEYLADVRRFLASN